jgi:chaperonin cofactor prefoldin
MGLSDEIDRKILNIVALKAELKKLDDGTSLAKEIGNLISQSIPMGFKA